MSTKLPVVAFLVLALVISSGCTQDPGTQVPGNGQTQVYTLSQVAEHATRGDCWMAIEGSVYNVTEFISAHPGGEAILQGCGKDATELFETRPMGSGTPHSSAARAMHPRYLIGTLA